MRPMTGGEKDRIAYLRRSQEGSVPYDKSGNNAGMTTVINSWRGGFFNKPYMGDFVLCP